MTTRQARDAREGTDHGALTPEALARLSNMVLRARVMVDGLFSGQHRSQMRGSSVEFADHREYAPGDDTRHLDWKLLARSGRDFVKQFDAETNLLVYIVLDVSRSMAYPPEGISKFQYAAYMAAGIAYLAWKQRDAPGLFMVNQGLVKALPPRSHRGHLSFMLQQLDEIEPRGASDLPRALGLCAPLVARRGLVVLLSDLWAPVEPTVRALRYFRHRGHDVLVLHILHPDEREFSFCGAHVFVDPEDGGRVMTDATLVRRHYKEAVEAHIRSYRDSLRGHSIDYHYCSTLDPFDVTLSKILAKRERLW